MSKWCEFLSFLSQNIVCMYGCKDSKSRRTSTLDDRFKSYIIFNNVFLSMINLVFFRIWNQSTVDSGGVSRGRSLAVGVNYIWKVTCHT